MWLVEKLKIKPQLASYGMAESVAAGCGIGGNGEKKNLWLAESSWQYNQY